MTLGTVLSLVIANLNEFKQAQVRPYERQTRERSSRERQGWKNPTREICKINFDVAFNSKKQKIALGIIIRYSQWWSHVILEGAMAS